MERKKSAFHNIRCTLKKKKQSINWNLTASLETLKTARSTYGKPRIVFGLMLILRMSCGI